MERLRSVHVDVDSDEVDERAWPDRPVEAGGHRGVEILGLTPGFVEDPHAVVQERDEDAG